MAKPTSASDNRMFSIIAACIAVGAFLLAALSIVVVAATDRGGSAIAAGTNEPIALTLNEFTISPKALTASAGEVTLAIRNAGAQVHNVAVPQLGKTSADIAGGASGTLDLGDVAPGTYQVICAIPGHEAAGMTATLTVGGASGGGTSAAAATAGAASGTGATIDPNAKPSDAFTPRDPTAPPPLPGTVHELTMETRETQLEVAPGVTQTMWTFNLEGEQPTVPGPILRGRIGDTFRITLVNRGQVDHSIDFHASKVAWSDEMRSIKPGESLVYEFTANFAGAYMYHCGTAPTLHHIGNGMYGAIIIDPPNLPPVAKEYVLVQSELYLGPEGKEGDLSKMQHDEWDAVVFNGYHSQYKHRPIQVQPDERIRVWVIDDGPSENSAFHVVGTVFDTVWKEGTYLLQPDQRKGGAQVLDLQPAQGGFVEFTFAEQGYYPIVTHKFSNVGKGAIGLFRAGDPPPLTGGGH